LDFGGEDFADTRVIGDAFLGHANGADAGSVGLDFAQLIGAEKAQIAEAVFLAALEQRLEARDFILAGGDHHFAADFVRDGVATAEVDHLADAADGEAGAPGSGLVVEAAVKHSAVVAALVAADAAFFFEQGDVRAGHALQQAVCGGQANDSAAYDNDARTHTRYHKGVLIVMTAQATAEDIARVQRKIESLGFRPHVIPGVQKTAIGITGNPGPVDPAEFEELPGVAEAIRVSRPYKLVSRETKPDNTVVCINGVPVGGGELAFCGGPCSVESHDQILESARAVKAAGGQLLRGGAFKPRTSPYSFQGLGELGLKLLAEAREATGLGVVTEAIDVETFDMVEEYADCVQIGARNMQNYSLLRRAGRSRRPVLLKRGMSATLEEFLMAAEYLLSEGNYQVILCERGVRTFADHSRNTLDLSVVPAVQRLSHLPIIVDPSHGTGKRDQIHPMSMAAIGAGASGLIVEVHPTPDQALSDGYQSLYPEQFAEVVRDCRAIAELLSRR
jgi:3-deoxy-7-phosphoheptulonate synthase